MVSIFIFHRDLRVEDNVGLNYCLDNFKSVLPIFVFDRKQLKSNYSSVNSINFMLECLEELQDRVVFFMGDLNKILKKLIEKYKVENIVFNVDYTPFARYRDDKVRLLCEKNNIKCMPFEDYLYYPMGKIVKDDGNPYVIFTFFYNKFMEYFNIKSDIIIKNIKKIDKKLYIKNKKMIKQIYKKYGTKSNGLLIGGRIEALKILDSNNFKTLKKNYEEIHNYPSKDTTRMSAYIKFGCISIREMFNNFKSNEALIRQLIWREFYYYIGYYHPYVLGYEIIINNNQIKLKKIINQNFDRSVRKWKNNKKKFKLWCKGKLGIDMVDAGMKELNQTGFMHNRLRLITANYLVKKLNIDWKWGEKYFATKLIDYDPFVNNGNWQWCAGTGTDNGLSAKISKNGRVFNPELQQKKYDKDKLYINKYLNNI